ncbi:MAG: hypothetical protein QME61_01370 [Patescibacteria group bacterium]|nr:hypothetical protein [Patescibacteria group bacterium]
MLEEVERGTLILAIPISFLIFLFLPLNLGIKILIFSTLIYFLVLFYLASSWAEPMHPERKLKIGFLVSFLHTFLFIFGGVIGLGLANFFLFLWNYLKGSFSTFF